MSETTLTHRRVWKIAFPIMISNATVPLLGVVDTGVVGQMGEAAPIGAVGIGAIILSAIYWIFGFLRMGTVGLASQALGAEDHDEVAVILSRALLIAAAGALLVMVFQVPIFAGAFWISPATPEVEGLARAYMEIRIFSAPAIIALYGVTGWLIAQERTGAVLVIQVWMNGLNMLLDVVFVLGLGWGVEGVAIATFIAEWSGLLVGLWFCKPAFVGTAWKTLSRILERVKLKQMALLNGDIMIRSILLEAAFVSFLLYGGGFGDVPLAANQILLQFLHVTAFALDGFAFAAETLVGQAYGRKKRLAVRRAAWMTSLSGAGICLGLALVFALGGPMIIDLMTTDPEVQAEARAYLIWMTLAPVCGAAAWMFDGIFIGATRGADMRNMMFISFAIYCAAFAVLVPAYENHGLWISLLIFFVARGVTLGARYPVLERAAEG
jgi:MATE family multidrug resistance protein